jgi:hypothetical protein
MVSLSFKKSPWLFEKATFRLQPSLWEGGEKRNGVSRKRRLQPLLRVVRRDWQRQSLRLAEKPRITTYCNNFVTNGR